MNRDIEQLRTMVAKHDPARYVNTDEAKMSAVLERVLADAAPAKPARRSRRRWQITIPLAAVMAGTFVALPIVQPQDVGPVRVGPEQALAFTEHGDRIEVRIADPDADPARYRKEFAARGLNVDLRLKTTSPSLVGRMVSATVEGGHDAQRLKQLDGGRGCGRVWCKAGVSMPRDLRGHVILVFGRAPKPGENYEMPSPDGTAFGEPLAGLKLRGKTVTEVVHMAKQRNVTIVRYFAAPPSDREKRPEGWHYGEHILRLDQVPGDWYVHDVFTGRAPNTVELIVSPEPISSEAL